ncbi:MAG: chorismate-binding protein [Brumimicrobium sp.]
MKGFLAHKEPGKKPFYGIGSWDLTSLIDIPSDSFFVSDFEKKSCYFFSLEEEWNKKQSFSFFYKKDNSVLSLDKNSYLDKLSDFQCGFDEFHIEKAIFSRISLHKKSDEIGSLEIFEDLCQRYGDEAFVYLISDKSFGTWIGATPEVLVKGDKNTLYSMALAGTKSDDSIPWTDKEYEEQKIVSDYMKEVISSLKPSFFKEKVVKSVKNGAVFHLRTDFEFSLPNKKWNNLIDKLHPTPAVCGLPLDNSSTYISRHEPHDRLFYTGIIGRKSDSKISVYVNLRCMQVLENYFALYLGGGITKKSNPLEEWEETISKSQTLLSVFEK